MSGLPKRHLRFHFGGTFKDTGNVPNKLRCYSAGSKVDSKGWNGEEVCLLDLAKEVFKLVVVPEGKNIALSWFQLVRDKDYVNQRLPILDDPGVLYFWANCKQDSRNFLHLYVEFVGTTYLGSINRQLQTQLQPCLQATLPPLPPPSSQLGMHQSLPISVPFAAESSQAVDVLEIPPCSSEVEIVEELPPSTRQKLCVRRGKSFVKPKSPLKPKKKSPAKVCEYTCHGSEDHLYQVANYTGKHWNVDITAHSCTCGEWDLTGIPCIHAVRVLNFMRPDWRSYCSPYFTVEAYKRVYEGGIKPILHESDWNKITDVILPPIKSRKPGRPAVARRRGLDEGPIRYGGKKQVRCSICREYGHNKKTCTGGCPDYAAYVAATSKGPAKRGATDKGGRPMTRPRKIDYGVPVENIADDPAFSEFIAQFEPVVSNRAKGKGKKTYKGKGKRRGPSQHTFVPSQVPFDPSFYGYEPSQPTFDPSPQHSTPMHSAQIRTPMPGIQFRDPNPHPNQQFRNPNQQFRNPIHHPTMLAQQFRNPNPTMPGTSAMPQANVNQPQPASWKPPTNVNQPQPYMRHPPANRQFFRPQNVFFPLHGTRTARIAALLGVNEDGSSLGPTGSSQASTSNPDQPRWRI